MDLDLSRSDPDFTHCHPSPKQKNSKFPLRKQKPKTKNPVIKLIVMVAGLMIGRFIKDLEAFNRYADERLDLIEKNRTQKVK